MVSCWNLSMFPARYGSDREDILSLFGTVKQEDIKGMTLVCNGRIERRTELLSILSFRLKDAVMDEKGQAGKDV